MEEGECGPLCSVYADPLELHRLDGCQTKFGQRLEERYERVRLSLKTKEESEGE